MSEAARLRVDLAERSYDIAVGSGLLARAGAEIAALGGRDPIVVTDENLARTGHLDRLEAGLAAAGLGHRRVVLPAGEATKSMAQLEAIVGQLDETWFAPGTRILRQGLSGSGLYFVLDGSCAVEVNHKELARLGRGDFFGEISVLLGGAPVADVVAVTEARCLILPAPSVEKVLTSYPRLMYRMLQVQSRRLHNANKWRS